MKPKLYNWNIESELKTPEDRAAYIEAAMEEHDPEFMVIALGDVARAEGMSKGKTFLYGVLSGVVEPIAAAVTIVAAGAVVPVMPYLLAFAAGAMMYVVVEELIPEMSEGRHSNWGTIAFSLGFVLMMVLDVTLG